MEQTIPDNSNVLFEYIIPIGIVLIGILLSFTTDILKDNAQPDKPYSFARVQLMWWTLIIISCYTSYYGIYGVKQDLDSSTLILLGISIGTTTAARIIDNDELNRGMIRSKKNRPYRNMLGTIISDDNGISVSRFQALVFNLIYGFMFISEFLGEGNEFVDFDGVELGLMGISSAAYVGIKLNENKPSGGNRFGVQTNTMASTGAVPQETFEERDLVDIDERYAQDQSNKQPLG